MKIQTKSFSTSEENSTSQDINEEPELTFGERDDFDEKNSTSNIDESENTSMSQSKSNENIAREEVEYKANKRPKAYLRDPGRAANIKAAIDHILQLENNSFKHGYSRQTKNLKEVSRQFNIPYNTLRDNFLRVTTGHVRKSSVKEVLRNHNRMSHCRGIMSVPFQMTNFGIMPSSTNGMTDLPILQFQSNSAYSFPSHALQSQTNNFMDIPNFQKAQQLNFQAPSVPPQPSSTCSELRFSNEYYPVPPISKSLLAHAAALTSAQRYIVSQSLDSMLFPVNTIQNDSLTHV